MTPQTNPLSIKKYYIHESSSAFTDCPTDTYVASYIRSQDENRAPGDTVNSPVTTQTGPFTLLEIADHVNEYINKFTQEYSKMARCETYLKTIQQPVSTSTASSTSPSTSTSTASSTASSTSPSTSTAFSTSVVMPDGCDTYTRYKTYDRTATYHAFNSYPALSTSAPSGTKSLCQMEYDLKNILFTFDRQIDSLGPLPPDQSALVERMFKDNTTKRAAIDAQIDTLRQGTYVKDGKFKLDATIYTTTLWAVLATSIVYYAFLKM